MQNDNLINYQGEGMDLALLDNSANAAHQNVKSNRTAHSNVDLAELPLDLFTRLMKTGVIRASPNIKTLHDRQVVVLDQLNTLRYLNGQIFASYLIVLKEVMYKRNQDFSIDDNIANNMKEQTTPQARLFNWNYLCTELDVSH